MRDEKTDRLLDEQIKEFRNDKRIDVIEAIRYEAQNLAPLIPEKYEEEAHRIYQSLDELYQRAIDALEGKEPI